MVPVDADAVAVGASAGPPAPSVFKWEHLPAGFNISASPAVVPIEFGTVISVQGQGFLPGNGTSSICEIKSAGDNNFVAYRYGPVGDYDPMKRLNAIVINATHLQCKTMRLHNAAPATLRVSMDGGNTWLPGTPSLQFIALAEVAIGRRPYTAEKQGQLVVKLAGAPLLPRGALAQVSAHLPAYVYGKPLLLGQAPQGETTLLPFELGVLPPTVFADIAITVVFTGYGAVTYHKNFQRAPPPTNPNVSVVVVDHTTRGMLLGRGAGAPWLPFLAVGWFNSATTYAAESSGDGAFAPPPLQVDPNLVGGAARAAEWGRKGVNLVRMGWRNPPELMLAELDHMYAAGVYAMISVPTPGHCNDTAKPGHVGPARNCTADYENMRGNMTLVKEHPATWGYYICDDCCAGYNYLVELAVVYEMMKKIDPYHLTAGALECGEMHAFQEPHLSLDAPMRENYRPDLEFHANDGWRRGGMDGALRLPPMTFEPLINMADAVRQPRPKLAQAAAWLGVITADIPHQNWYVYNHIMYARWLLEDATSSLNAQMLELAPSLMGPVTTVHPSVTVLTGDEWVRAKAWRDVQYEAQHPANLCVHIAVASINVLPASFKLHIGGLCRAAGCPAGVLTASHLFNELYSVPAVGDGSGGHLLSDVLTPGSTAVFAVGCNAWRSAVGNLVNDPGFEATEMPLTPGFLTCAQEASYPTGTFKGKCKMEDKHAGSWGLTQEKELRDNRAAFFVDSRLPHSGRHSGRVWVPSAVPLTFCIPGHTTNLNGVHVHNDTEYAVELYARSFPPGMYLELALGGWTAHTVTPTSPLGITTYMKFEAVAPLPTAVRLSGEWSKVTLHVPPGVRPENTQFSLRLSTPGSAPAGANDTEHATGVFPAGSVWLDDVSVQNLTAIPPPGAMARED